MLCVVQPRSNRFLPLERRIQRGQPALQLGSLCGDGVELPLQVVPGNAAAPVEGQYLLFLCVFVGQHQRRGQTLVLQVLRLDVTTLELRGELREHGTRIMQKPQNILPDRLFQLPRRDELAGTFPMHTAAGRPCAITGIVGMGRSTTRPAKGQAAHATGDKPAQEVLPFRVPRGHQHIAP